MSVDGFQSVTFDCPGFGALFRRWGLCPRTHQFDIHGAQNELYDVQLFNPSEPGTVATAKLRINKRNAGITSTTSTRVISGQPPLPYSLQMEGEMTPSGRAVG